MRFRFLLIGIALLPILLGGVASWIGQSYQKSPATSNALWQTQLLDLQGTVQKIPLPRERPIVINFWATWCGPCREEIPELADIALSLQGQVDFVGIAVDNIAAVKQFLGATTLPYPILLGQADIMDLMKSEGNIIGGLPFTVVYTAHGQQIMARAGKIQKDVFEKLLHSVINSPQ